jgi:hypothetical protein
MTTPSEARPADAVDAIARARYTVLKRADEILGDESGIPMVERADALPGVSALLIASLEELKVAEQELRIQNAALESQRA